MTNRSITSEQRKQYKRFVDDGGRKALRRAGLDREGLQRLLGREFQDYMPQGIQRFSAKQPDYSLARDILGDDFISPEDIMKVSEVSYRQEHLDALHEHLPSEEILWWCKEHGYVLVAAPPHSINLLQVRMLDSWLFCQKPGGWYSEQDFAIDNKTGTGWFMIRKNPVPDSTNKNWNEQAKLLSSFEYVPNSAEVSWLVTIYFGVRGIGLLTHIYVRCSDLDSHDDPVLVGRFYPGGRCIFAAEESMRDITIGLASARE